VRTATKAACATGLGLLLVGPTVLAFRSGGFYDEPRLWAAIAAWLLVVVAAVCSPRPLPRRLPGRLALGGLALLAAVVGASIAWAPLTGTALADFERLLLYAAVAVAATALLGWRRLARVVEPALAAGAAIVIGYALSNRLLPGVIEQAHSVRAGGRLEQPLTYWNAMGALAAIGVVLCARLAGDVRRPIAMRVAAAAATAPLGMGLWLSYSRGALAAVGAGLVMLALLAPERPQLRSIALALPGAIVCSVVAEMLHGVRSLEGSLAEREKEGLVMLAVLAVAMALTAACQLVLARRERDGRLRTDRIGLPGRAAGIAAVAVIVVSLVGTAVVVVARHGGDGQPAGPAFGATSERFRTFESNRYEYWKVAVGVFADNPLGGGGSGSFLTYWNQRRAIDDGARDAHSLYVETAAELGLAGLLALGLFLGGGAATAVRARRVDPALAAGPIAAVCVWLVHAGVDWDWEMPAVSLLPLLLIAALVATSEDAPVPTEQPAPPEADPHPAQPPAAPASARAGA
jgi:hypothetical protein